MSDKHSRLNRIYHHMKQRCHNPTDAAYFKYGGRGITVCERWLESYQNFKDDMQNTYSDDLTLERIDNNKGYSPDNCKWASKKEQANNRRSNHWVTIRGTRKTMAQWIEISGIKQSTVYMRLHYGWQLEKALELENYGV